MCAAFPVATGVSGASGSATVAKGQDCRHMLHCSLSSTSFMYSSPSTFRSRFLDLSGPSVLGRGTFVDLQCFTSCRMKGRGKEGISPHDADITSNLVLKVMKLKPRFIG